MPALAPAVGVAVVVIVEFALEYDRFAAVESAVVCNGVVDGVQTVDSDIPHILHGHLLFRYHRLFLFHLYIRHLIPLCLFRLDVVETGDADSRLLAAEALEWEEGGEVYKYNQAAYLLLARLPTIFFLFVVNCNSFFIQCKARCCAVISLCTLYARAARKKKPV